MCMCIFTHAADLMRPEAVEALTATYDLTLSQVMVVWNDSSNAADENLTYYVTYSVTGRDTLIFNSSTTLNSTLLEFVISDNFVQEGAAFNISVQACNNFGLGAPTMTTIQIPGGKKGRKYCRKSIHMYLPYGEPIRHMHNVIYVHVP